jgi:hypothetical protein
MGNTVSLSEPDEVLFAVWRKRRLDDNEEDEQYFEEFAHIANHTVHHRGINIYVCPNAHSGVERVVEWAFIKPHPSSSMTGRPGGNIILD